MIQQQLSPGERLLWSGQPRAGVVFRSADFFMIPFSLMWGGFAIYWEAMAVTSDGPFFFKLWGIPFVLIGLYMIVGRFFWDSFARGRTFYGLSDQRVIIVATATGTKVTSLPLRGLPQITLSEKSDGSGTIQFGHNPSMQSAWFAGTAWPGVQQAPSFEVLENAKNVYEQIRQAQQRAV